MSWVKLKENYLGVFWGLIVAAIVIWLNPKYSSCISFIKAIPQLTSCIFGFLLALLGIILQGDSPTITAIKSRTTVYNRFIRYNKKVVYLSLILSVLTLVIGYVDYSFVDGWLANNYICLKKKKKKVVLSSISFGIVWLFVDLVCFLRLFYLLVTAPERTGNGKQSHIN